MIVGCDPGASGALAFMDEGERLLGVEDMPVLDDGTKGRGTVNAVLLAAILKRWAPAHAFVELIGPRPRDARVAAFSFGRCRGAIEGVAGALAIPITMLVVPSWRRAVGLPPGATKDQARGETIRRWPEHGELFARKRDDGRAEACLIAVAGLKRAQKL
jgi:crossover junction endodeoxyribonuclease RuvC